MNKRIRLAKGDKVEIIDRNSPYFGKTGELIEIQPAPTEMINSSSKVISSKVEYYCKVKLEDTETTVVFTLTQLDPLPDKTVN